MTMCESVQRAIWSGDDPARTRTHVETCDDCRVEAARAGSIAAAFSSMRLAVAEPPPELLPVLLAAARPRSSPREALQWLGRAGRLLTHPHVRVGAVGAAAASAAVLGFALARRRSRPALAA